MSATPFAAETPLQDSICVPYLIIYAATISPIYAVWASRFAMGYVPPTSCGYIFSLISYGMLSSSCLWVYSTLHSRVRGYSFIPGTLIFSGFSSVRCAFVLYQYPVLTACRLQRTLVSRLALAPVPIFNGFLRAFADTGHAVGTLTAPDGPAVF